MAGGQQAFLTCLVIEHLQQTNEEVRRSFAKRYKQRLFPLSQLTTAQTKWRSHCNVIRVTLWGRDHFRNNVRIAMICEVLGLGPQYYCIMRSSHLGFAKRVFLLIQFLPHSKMYLYPNFGLPLRGPFDQPPWTREISVAMSQRVIPFQERPLMSPTCNCSFCNHIMGELVKLWLIMNGKEFALSKT